MNGLRFLYALLPFFVRRFLYGIQKLSFQGVRVVSHRRGLLEIPLKAKLPIFIKLSSVFLIFFAKIIQTALSAVWIIAYLNEITDKPEVLILSLAAVMQSSYFDYYHLTAGKKRLWATQMGSAFWISSVVGGHHNLMLRRPTARESTLSSTRRRKVSFSDRIVAMGRFIRPVDMQQHKGVAFRRAQGCLCLGAPDPYPHRQ